MEDRYGRSGDEEDLCKNGKKVAEWRTKRATCASMSKHFGATRNGTQLAEKSCYWRWVMDLLSTIHSPNGRALNGRAHCHQDPKRWECSSPKPGWCWSLFFDVHGIVDAEFLPQGQTINQYVYKNIVRRLMRSVMEKRRELWETRSWLLHHDNAPAHNALGIRKFLAKNNIA